MEQQKSRDKIEKLRRLNTYEGFFALFESLLNQIHNEQINILDFRANIKTLCQKIIQEVSENEAFYIQMLAYLEGPDIFISHSINTAIFSFVLADNLKLNEDITIRIISAALLHDIGKLDFSEKIKEVYILRKDDPAQVWKNHPIWGERILNYHLKTSKEIYSLVLRHHEYPDGSGFPSGLKDSQLTIQDNIICIANLIDNLLQKTKFSGLDILKKTIEAFIKSYSGRLFTPVKNILSDIFNLSGKARKNRRYRISAKGQMQDPLFHVVVSFEIVDISSGGIKIITKEPVGLNDNFKINCYLTQNLVIRDKLCKVIRSEKEGNHYVYGLQFEIPGSEIIDELIKNIQH